MSHVLFFYCMIIIIIASVGSTAQEPAATIGCKVNSQSFIAAATQMFELALETCSHECTTVRSSADLRIKSIYESFVRGLHNLYVNSLLHS